MNPTLKITGSFLKQRGMTLLETMISLTIGAAMIGMALLSSVDLYKNLAAAETYSKMHDEARQALALMSRDIRCAISNATLSSTHLTLRTIDYTGATNTVEYLLQANANDPSINDLVCIQNSASPNVMTGHAASILFEYWNCPGLAAATAYDTAEIRVSLMITNDSAFRLTTDLLQTRVMMRNKHL